jgi:hypothetical protein
MDDKNFEEICRDFEGRYNPNRMECILDYNSYNKMKELQEAIQSGSKLNMLNIKDINSGRDTNLDSFDTFDEIFDENGTVAIRRPNNVNIYNSIVKLDK